MRRNSPPMVAQPNPAAVTSTPLTTPHPHADTSTSGGKTVLIENSKLVFQGITPDDHLAALNYLLALPNPTRIILSAAFMTKAGLLHLSESLSRVAATTDVFVGIRNGVTTAQGLRLSVELGCSTYVIDTGSRSVLYHPKVFLSYNNEEARLVIGSANLTVGGLINNIEASLLQNISLTEESQVSPISDIQSIFDRLVSEYEDHVIPIHGIHDIRLLYDAGRVNDEMSEPEPVPANSPINRDLDRLDRIRLKTRQYRTQQRKITRSSEDLELLGSVGTQSRSKLVWQSNPLSRRHLNLPSGSNTNPTGSMFFSKGTMDEIDQRHYFRDDVFSELSWEQDFIHPHYERAVANFRIVIRNVDCGTFMLQVSHNTRTDFCLLPTKQQYDTASLGACARSYSQGRSLRSDPPSV